MRSAPYFFSLSLLAAGCLTGQSEEPDLTNPVKRPRLSPALDLLPAGSTLKEVIVPRYDKEKRRASLLRAGALKVVSEDHVTGENIEVRLFSKEQEENLRIHMGAAEYFLQSGTIEAQEVLTVRGEGFKARGTGGSFHLDSRQGIVDGPITTSLTLKSESEEQPPGKAPDSPDTPPVPAPVAVVVPEYIEPTPLTPEQLRQLEAISQPRRNIVLADGAPTRALITDSEQWSQAADFELRSFVHRIGRPEFMTDIRPGETLPGLVPDNSEPEKGIHVSCEGGMYIDAIRGRLAYLRNIEVIEERFTMTCSDELKVFFDPVEDFGKVDFEQTDSVSNVKMIVATGSIRVVYPDPQGKKEPIIATAETAIIDAVNRDVVLMGGTPTIRQGNNLVQAGQPELYLRFYRNGSIFAERGRWITKGDLSRLEIAKTEEETPETEGTQETVPEIMEITCDEGMFFDSTEGHLVYLGNVEVKNTDLRMTCTEELKVLLEPKEQTGTGSGSSSDEDGKKDMGGLDSFGDVKAIVASGNVRVEQLNPGSDRPPVTATASTASFDAKTGEMILHGGNPAIRQGTASLVADKPDLYLRFFENGSLYAESGPWTTTGDIANLRKKSGEKLDAPEIITVSCDRGLLFDSYKGQVIYTGGLKVVEPRFRMNSPGKMTVYLSKKENAEEEQLEGPEAFADVKTIVVTGGVTVVRKDPSGKSAPVVATAEAATYDAESGDFALRGGYPEVRRGTSFLKAQEKGLYLRFYKNGNFWAPQGNWLTSGNIKELRKNQE